MPSTMCRLSISADWWSRACPANRRELFIFEELITVTMETYTVWADVWPTWLRRGYCCCCVCVCVCFVFLRASVCACTNVCVCVCVGLWWWSSLCQWRTCFTWCRPDRRCNDVAAGGSSDKDDEDDDDAGDDDEQPVDLSLYVTYTPPDTAAHNTQTDWHLLTDSSSPGTHPHTHTHTTSHHTVSCPYTDTRPQNDRYPFF